MANMQEENIPDNFLGIEEVDPKEAEIVILPIPLEITVSYGKGTGNGPKAIIKASQHVELYDHELGYEVNEKVKISTLPYVEVEHEQDLDKVQEIINEAAKPWTDKFILSLGGEHSITPALVKAYQEKYPDISILYFDAHTDMREEWGGTKWSHACAARRCQEQGIKNIVWVGIRNTALSEQQYIDKTHVNYGNKYDLPKILSQLGKNVYISFDVDVLDSSVMPATGTPEPGGLTWYQVMEIFEAVTREKNVVGADIAECAPIEHFHAYDFLVAKLAFKLIGYKFRK